MRINYRDNQEEILNCIRTEIKDELIMNHVLYTVDSYIYEANLNNMLRRIGEHGVWVKLKNGTLFHATSVYIKYFSPMPTIIIDTSEYLDDFKALLKETHLQWIYEGLTWWADESIEEEDKEND